MVTKLYVIYDKVAEEAGPILEAKNDAVATRQFISAIAKGSVFKSDFELVNIGTLDHDTMLICACEPHTIEIVDTTVESED